MITYLKLEDAISINDFIDLRNSFEDLVGYVPLERLHDRFAPDGLVTRETDSLTELHKRVYSHLENETDEGWDFILEYRKLVTGLCDSLYLEPYYYQALPSIRFHMPNNLAVGEFHNDGAYGHSAFEQNFWVPLTSASGTTAVQLQDVDYREEPYQVSETSLDCDIRDVVIFDGANIPHGNFPNSTTRTRVSFDFRVILARHYLDSGLSSINSGLGFKLGEYFTDEGTKWQKRFCG